MFSILPGLFGRLLAQCAVPGRTVAGSPLLRPVAVHRSLLLGNPSALLLDGGAGAGPALGPEGQQPSHDLQGEVKCGLNGLHASNSEGF